MPTQAQEIQQTLDAYKSGLAPQIGMLTPDASKAWNLATGFQPYNLQPVALTLIPQLTPVRNVTPRVQGRGAKAEYKAVTALNSAGLQGWVAQGAAASVVTTTTTDNTATYRSFALGDTVTFEQQWAGRGFLDTKALAVVNLLRATMIAEENALLWGQNSTQSSTEQAPGAIGNAADLANPTTATTGGSIAGTTTVYWKQTAITGMGESLPSSNPASVTTGAGSTNSIVVTPVFTASQPIVGFRIYYSTSSGGTYSLITTSNVTASRSDGQLPGGSLTWITNGAPITVTSLPTTGATTVPAADASASSLAYNGIYPQSVYGTGATLTKAAGTLSTTTLNTHFKTMWNSAYKVDPDMMLVHATESVNLTTLTLGAGTPYYVMVGDQPAATANFRVARYTNPVTGSEVPVRVHPTAPQGTILTLSSKLPGWYVPTDVPNVWAIDTCQDYVEIDYPPNQASPFWQVEVRCFSALKLYIPGLQGAVYDIWSQ